ncbi:RimJ/RimL family protein N-acetyltransferase [Micromonospora pisi]|uniref:RimJ/RimL family protein N-acetyltransferase n=1 Tax=Micromonospora pisi TaxID=589240 RepID=A0A495JMG6_9ACTN|nr:GNAT family protein [Micromonospora pisi]RKR89534.1 RimJ/RimL family protein N-acetyltransferase [Micromonospora pisi]
MQPEPVNLIGNQIELVPLTEAHLPDLTKMARHDEIWTYLDEATPQTEPEVAALITEALEEQDQGVRLPFAIIDRDNGQAIGTMSYIDIQRAHRGIELGWAWISPDYWQRGIAREAAYLLMRHAFEALGAIRVAFKTDARNVRSQRTIEGLGATQEGTFRNHRILRDGYRRSSIYYSVIDDEWPAVRTALEAKLRPRMV